MAEIEHPTTMSEQSEIEILKRQLEDARRDLNAVYKEKRQEVFKDKAALLRVAEKATDPNDYLREALFNNAKGK